MLRIFRHFSQLRDPYFIPRALRRCKYTGSALEIYETQSHDFNMEEYGISWVDTLKRTEKTVQLEPESEQNKPLKKVFEDARFEKFIGKLNEEKLKFGKYLKIVYELSWLYSAVDKPLNNETLKRFQERVEARRYLTLDQTSMSLAVLSRAGGTGEDIKNFANSLSQRAIKLLETEVPNRKTSVNLILSHANLNIQAHELLKILEPYVLSNADTISPKHQVQIFQYYGAEQCGSKAFMQQLLFLICVKIKEISAYDISRLLDVCAYKLSDILQDPESTIKLLLQELMKKLGDVDEHVLIYTLPTLPHSRVGNPHYYELLGMQWVKHMDKYDAKGSARLIHAAADGNLSSPTIIKAINKAIKPIMMNVSPLIYDISDSKVQSPLGLIGNEDVADLELKNLAREIIGAPLKKNKSEIVTVDDIYETNGHPFFKLNHFLDFAWGLIKIGHQSEIKKLDADSWSLVIQLLKKHISHITKADKTITYEEYEKISQIAFLSNTTFPTLPKVTIPRTMTDFTLHEDSTHYRIYNEARLNNNLEFEDEFANFCIENKIPYHLPKRHSAGTFTKDLLIGDTPFFINAKASKPVIVAREHDLFDEGQIRGLLRSKLNIMVSFTKFSLLRYDEWMAKGKTKDYFKSITE